MVVRNHEDLDWRDLGRVAALSRDEMMSRPMAYTMYAGKTIQRPLSSLSVIESKPERERERESRGNRLGNNPEEDQGNQVIMTDVVESREILIHPCASQ